VQRSPSFPQSSGVSRSTRNSVSDIELEDIPAGLADTLRHDDRGQPLQFHTRVSVGSSGPAPIFFGHGIGGAEDKRNIVPYFRELDRGLRDLLRDERAPLVLAGVEHLLPPYREANSYRQLFGEGIAGSPELMTAEDLHTWAWAVAATDRDEGRKPLGKHTPQTGCVPAEEATDLQMQEELYPGKRQVGDRAPVGTMHGSRAVLTARTHGRAPPEAEVKRQPAINPVMDQQAKAGEVRQERW
jgi:release factor family 7